MRKKLVATFIVCSIIGSLCLNGCSGLEADQTMESVEETEEEMAEAEGADETKEAIEVQSESNHESSEKETKEKEKTEKAIRINISDDEYEYIFGENSRQKIFGVNLDIEEGRSHIEMSRGPIVGEDGTEIYQKIRYYDYINDFCLDIALITDENISWLKEYLKEEIYQESSMVELPHGNFSEYYKLLKLEKKEEIETRYGNIQIVYFEGNMDGWDGKEYFERKEIAYFNVNNHDGLVAYLYSNSATEYEGILSEVLPSLFEPKQ